MASKGNPTLSTRLPEPYYTRFVEMARVQKRSNAELLREVVIEALERANEPEGEDITDQLEELHSAIRGDFEREVAKVRQVVHVALHAVLGVLLGADEDEEERKRAWEALARTLGPVEKVPLD